MNRLVFWQQQFEVKNVFFCSFLLHNMLIDGLDGLLVDYCDAFISCLDSHSDGTHSLQMIHWWGSHISPNLFFLAKFSFLGELFLYSECVTVWEQGPRSVLPAWRPAEDAQTPRRERPESPPRRPARLTLLHLGELSSWIYYSTREINKKKRNGSFH